MTQNRVNRHGIDDKDVFTGALKTTVPVFLGYIPLGMAFGFLLDGAGYHWIYAFLMSLLVYAGSGQFLAVALLAAGRRGARRGRAGDPGPAGQSGVARVGGRRVHLGRGACAGGREGQGGAVYAGGGVVSAGVPD